MTLYSLATSETGLIRILPCFLEAEASSAGRGSSLGALMSRATLVSRHNEMFFFKTSYMNQQRKSSSEKWFVTFRFAD